MNITQKKYALYAIFVLSGIGGLIYESIWSHYLKLFLGHAAYAQSLVLIIFMGGMGFGAWLAAQYSHRWKNLLLENVYLFSDTTSLADIAIFPFVRQFAAVDSAWFEASPYPKLQVWLSGLIESELFISVMEKQPTYIE